MKRKTYTIYINERSPIDLQHMKKGRAEGAMLVFKMRYNQDHIVCECDQTREIIDEQVPRKIHINSSREQETVIRLPDPIT